MGAGIAVAVAVLGIGSWPAIEATRLSARVLCDGAQPHWMSALLLSDSRDKGHPSLKLRGQLIYFNNYIKDFGV